MAPRRPDPEPRPSCGRRPPNRGIPDGLTDGLSVRLLVLRLVATVRRLELLQAMRDRQRHRLHGLCRGHPRPGLRQRRPVLVRALVRVPLVPVSFVLFVVPLVPFPAFVRRCPPQRADGAGSSQDGYANRVRWDSWPTGADHPTWVPVRTSSAAPGAGADGQATSRPQGPRCPRMFVQVRRRSHEPESGPRGARGPRSVSPLWQRGKRRAFSQNRSGRRPPAEVLSFLLPRASSFPRAVVDFIGRQLDLDGEELGDHRIGADRRSAMRCVSVRALCRAAPIARRNTESAGARTCSSRSQARARASSEAVRSSRSASSSRNRASRSPAAVSNVPRRRY